MQTTHFPNIMEVQGICCASFPYTPDRIKYTATHSDRASKTQALRFFSA